MRNIVYLILILIFVIIGMGIMLRVHIDPRTVMTLQNQIPKIIVGILAISFSFAIAGLLIDIMWVSIYLFAGVINTAATAGGGSVNLMGIVTADNPFTAAGAAFTGGIAGIANMTASAFSSLIQAQFMADWGIFGNVFGGIIHLLVLLVVLIAIIIVLFRLWVTLIIAYIYIILDVIFAPFFILAGLLPGSSMGLGAWLRDLIANLAVFPVAIGFFLLGNYLSGQFSATNSEIVSRFSPPLVAGMNPTGVAALIGFGFILMLPNLLTTMKAALKAPKMNFGPMLGPVSSGMGAPKRLVTGTQSYVGGPRTEMKVGGGVDAIRTRTRLARAFGVIK